MPCPLLTSTKLANGIQSFLAHPKWPKDFHNSFYASVTAAVKSTGSLLGPSVGAYKPAGSYGNTAWDDIVFELSQWKALRPYHRLLFHGHPNLPALNTTFSVMGAGLPYTFLPVSDPPQAQLLNLFSAAAAIKPVTAPSPVFPSKCCHMILPWEFPVWDNQFAGNTGTTRNKMRDALSEWDDLDKKASNRLAVCLNRGLISYWCYREYLLLAWDTLQPGQQANLIAQLNAAILAAPLAQGVVPWLYFPYRTKIPELCIA